MITPELHAEIRRLYFGEHWKVGTIAAALGVHHDTVRAALAHDTRALPRGRCRRRSSTPICRSCETPSRSIRGSARRGCLRWSARAAIPARSSNSAASCAPCDRPARRRSIGV